MSSGNYYCIIQVQFMYQRLCHLLSVNCSSPRPPVNGFIESETPSTLVFRCSQGYTPQTSVTSFCVARDTWTPDPVNFNCLLESQSK